MYMKSSRSVARSMFANMPCRFVGLYIHCNALQHTLQHALQQEYVSKHDMSLCGSAHIHCDIHCNIHCNTRCNTHCNRSMSANMTCHCEGLYIHCNTLQHTATFTAKYTATGVCLCEHDVSLCWSVHIYEVFLRGAVYLCVGLFCGRSLLWSIFFVVGLFCGAVHIYGGLVGVDGHESNLNIHIYIYEKQQKCSQEYVREHPMSFCGSVYPLQCTATHTATCTATGVC